MGCLYAGEDVRMTFHPSSLYQVLEIELLMGPVISIGALAPTPTH